jgi:hypothetical protein
LYDGEKTKYLPRLLQKTICRLAGKNQERNSDHNLDEGKIVTSKKIKKDGRTILLPNQTYFL